MTDFTTSTFQLIASNGSNTRFYVRCALDALVIAAQDKSHEYFDQWRELTESGKTDEALVASIKQNGAREMIEFLHLEIKKFETITSEDEIIKTIRECLSVITHQGAGSMMHWLEVGKAIHAALPTDKGLVLWSNWSSQDPDYAKEWVDIVFTNEESGNHPNPCSVPWYSFKSSGIGLDTLNQLADKEDPERHRSSTDFDIPF